MTFRLEALLRVRKNEEDEELKRLGEVNAYLARQKESLEFMSNLEQKNSKSLDVQRERNPDLNLFWLYNNFFDGMLIQKQRSNQIISEVSEKLEVRRKALIEAMRKRKMLEILKQRAVEVREMKIMKRERDQLDEAASNLWRRQFLI